MSSTDVGGAFGEPGPPGTSGRSPKEMAQDAAQTVKQEAASFAEGAREKAVDAIDRRKETASRTLGDFANAIRRAGDELDQSDQSMATRMVRQAADGLEGFARSVADKRPEEMLEAVREFGRRNPTAFIAGSVLAGIAIGRFFRSSSSHAAKSGPAESAAFAIPPAPGEADALADPQAADVAELGASGQWMPTDALGTSDEALGAGRSRPPGSES